jgi:Flp pilus assembly protein TadD
VRLPLLAFALVVTGSHYPTAAVAVPPAPTLSAATATPPARVKRSPKRRKPVAAADGETPILISVTPLKSSPALEQAYQAFNAGNPDLARTTWEKILRTEPYNSDALHGLAAVALQRGHSGEAAEFYAKALEANPKDALAISGLLSLRMPADSPQAESRLKTLLAEQPESPYLHFALGNLLARNARWAEAQQSYFTAHTLAPLDPDYLFNLAVSLDQLHQTRLAAQYYLQALAAAAVQPAGFDAAQLAARLQALQPAR